MTALKSGDRQYDNFKSLTQPTNGGSQTYWMRFRWGSSEVVSLTQTNLLEAGKYTLSADVFFITSSGTAVLSAAGVTKSITASGTDKTKGTWSNVSLDFTLTEEKTVTIAYTLTQKKQEETVAGLDNFKLVFTADKSTVKSTIDKATTANKTLNSESLTAAITTAQAVYDNASATQSEIDNAVTTLKSAVNTALASLPSGEVTSVFLANSGFEDSKPLTANVRTYAKDVESGETSGLNDVTSWVRGIDEDAKAAGVYAYGTSYLLGGQVDNTNTSAPATAPTNGGNNALGIVATWSCPAQYTQPARYSLPAGKYTLTADVYNSVGAVATPAKDLFGFVTSDGTECLATAKSFNANEWTTEDVTFTLTKATDGCFTIGYTASGVGNGSQPHLYYDNIKLTYANPADAYNEARNEAITLRDGSDYTNILSGSTERAALETAIGDGTTPSDYDAATTALNTAIANFKAAKDAYDSYAEEKARAEKLGATVGDAPTTASAATDALKTINVAEYNAVTEKYTAPIDLGTWNKDQSKGNIKDRTGQHWSDNNSKKYIDTDNWNSSSWSVSLSQDVTLPAGTYVFKATGRKSAGSSLTLKVTDADNNEIGVVSNFPSNDTGYGVTKYGTACFSADSTYANSNAGRGWQWRFVPFTIENETKVSFTITASASATANWVSFSDYTVQAVPSVATATTAYKQAYANAQTALNSEDYKNIGETASERTALAAYPESPTGTTMEAIDNETAAVKTAIETFTAAKTSYNAFAAAKALGSSDLDLKYASSEKKTAFTTAYDATPTTAESAATAATALTNALRAYYESNAKAEGITGAREVYTYNFTDVTVSGTTVGDWTASQTGGDLSVKSNESWTDASGKNTYGYFNYYNSSANNQHATHTVSLEAGKYILTIKARAQSGLNTHLTAAGKDLDLQEIGNTGGVFGRGWNDATLEFTTPKGDVTLEWYSAPYNGSNKAGWAGFGDVRLYKIGELETVELKEDASDAPDATDSYANVTYNRTFNTGWNSIILPFDVTATELTETLGADDAIKYDGTDGTTINFSSVKETGLTANTPYMIHVSDAKTSVTFSGKKIAPTTELTTADGKGQYNFVGTYVQAETSPIEAGDYVVVSGGIQKAKGGNTLKAFRAYFDAQSAEATAKSFNFTIDGNVVTGVKAIELQNAVDDGAVYNLAGQRVSDSYKGVVIKNGKKYVK